jgi:predicted amidohydrolase
MTANMKIAVCQMRVSEWKSQNLKHAGEMIRKASQQGAHMVILPEFFNAPYNTRIMAENAECFPGETTAFLSEQASNNAILLVGGSIPEVDEDGKLYNTSYVFDEQGLLIGKHRKMHLFDIDIPGQINFKESEVLTAGDDLQIIRHNGLSCAVIICYDIRFPELARMAALQGAQILIIPAAFNGTTGPVHWELLMRTRAVDNQLFVVAASPAHNPEASYQPWGHSLVVDPWGTVISEAGTDEEILVCNLDLSILGRVRRELPLLKHRRTDIYELNYKK